MLVSWWLQVIEQDKWLTHNSLGLHINFKSVGSNVVTD